MISSLVTKLLLLILKALKTHFLFDDDIQSNKKRLLLSFVDFGAKTLMNQLTVLQLCLLNLKPPKPS